MWAAAALKKGKDWLAQGETEGIDLLLNRVCITFMNY